MTTERAAVEPWRHGSVDLTLGQALVTAASREDGPGAAQVMICGLGDLEWVVIGTGVWWMGWQVQGGIPGAAVACATAEQVLAVVSGWHVALQGDTPWYVIVWRDGVLEPHLIVFAGAELGPVFWNLEGSNAQSIGELPPRQAAAPRTWKWPNGNAPSDPDDLLWADYNAWVSKGWEEAGDEDELTFRMAGEWENPEPETLIPYQQAFDALAEFLVIGMRPTNVAWEDL